MREWQSFSYREDDDKPALLDPTRWNTSSEARSIAGIVACAIVLIVTVHFLGFFGAVNLLLVFIASYAIIGEQRSRSRRNDSPPCIEHINNKER